MVLRTPTHGMMDAAVRAVVNELNLHRHDVSSWRDFPEEELWHELAACILGSAVSYTQACFSVESLTLSGLLRPPKERSALDSFEKQIANALSGRYRFPFTRAHHLRRTAERIYCSDLSLSQLLDSEREPPALRAKLVRIGVGVGPKQASLFLRNVRYADFAVLDRHVVRFMLVRGLIRSAPKLQALAEYEEIEKVFFQYADQIAGSVADLDMAVWIVARAMGRELLA